MWNYKLTEFGWCGKSFTLFNPLSPELHGLIGTTIQNLFLQATWHPEFVHICTFISPGNMTPRICAHLYIYKKNIWIMLGFIVMCLFVGQGTWNCTAAATQTTKPFSASLHVLVMCRVMVKMLKSHIANGQLWLLLCSPCFSSSLLHIAPGI